MAQALAWPGVVVFVSLLLAWEIDISDFIRGARIRIKRGETEVEIIQHIPKGSEILEERRSSSHR
jgi:hypothetical protein